MCLPVQEIRVRSLSQEDPLGKEIATHSSILAWEIQWTEEPGRLQSMGSAKNGHNLATRQQQCVYVNPKLLIYPSPLAPLVAINLFSMSVDLFLKNSTFDMYN